MRFWVFRWAVGVLGGVLSGDVVGGLMASVQVVNAEGGWRGLQGC